MIRKKIFTSAKSVLLLVTIVVTIFVGINISQANCYVYSSENSGVISSFINDNEIITYSDIEAKEEVNNGKSIYEPNKFMLKANKGKKNLMINEIENKLLSVPQFSQKELNSEYNSKNNTKINGTCGIVALSTLTYYFSQKLDGYSNLPDDINDIFDDYVKMYEIKGEEGTKSSTYKEKTKEYFARYGYKMKTERTTAINKFTKIRKHLKNDRPTIIAVSGSKPYSSHAMLVVGYRKYKVKYKKGFIPVTDEQMMYIIDEGWGMERYAYLHEDYMPENWEITNIWRA